MGEDVTGVFAAWEDGADSDGFAATPRIDGDECNDGDAAGTGIATGDDAGNGIFESSDHFAAFNLCINLCSNS